MSHYQPLVAYDDIVWLTATLETSVPTGHFIPAGHKFLSNDKHRIVTNHLQDGSALPAVRKRMSIVMPINREGLLSRSLWDSAKWIAIKSPSLTPLHIVMRSILSSDCHRLAC
ncbi:hypothetical protein FPOAC2_11047 [Fusarium poae]